MKHHWIVLIGCLFAGCAQVEEPKAKAKAKAKPACVTNSECAQGMNCDPIQKRCVPEVIPLPTVVDAQVPQLMDASVSKDAQEPTVVVTPVKPTKKPSQTRQTCKSKRRSIEGKYQRALNSKKSKACKRDSDCLLLPKSTLCGEDRCIYDGGAVNRRQAKRIKAIQYDADLKICDTLTRSCETKLYRDRGAHCASKKRKAYCENDRCVAKAPRLTPKPVKMKARAGAQLILGTTRTDDRRYKMDITQSLMFARNAAFEACLQYPGSKSGTVTFEFRVSTKGTLQGLRQVRSSVPKRMGLCLKTWLKSLRYPTPKQGATTVTQVIRYLAP